MKKIIFLIAILSIMGSSVNAKTINIEYILDASGSMLETIQDVRKIDIAKETLSGDGAMPVDPEPHVEINLR